jgi:hypothetical protein
MRGKRSLRKIEAMSTNTTHVYECGSCSWMMEISADRNFSEIHAEFDGHDCKENLLKERPNDYQP